MVTNSSWRMPSSRCTLQEPLQRILNQFLLPLDVAAEAAQGGAGVVGHRAVRQDFPRQVAHHRAEFPHGGAACPQLGKAFGNRQQQGADLGGPVQQLRHLVDFLGFQSGAFDPQLAHRFRGVSERVEPDAHRGAPGRGLGPRRRFQVLNRFGHLRQDSLDGRPVLQRRHLVQFGAAQRAGDIPREQLLEPVEFQQLGARVSHRRAFSITPSVPSVIW